MSFICFRGFVRVAFQKNKPQTRFVNPVPSAAEFVPTFTPPTPAAPALEEDIDM